MPIITRLITMFFILGNVNLVIHLLCFLEKKKKTNLSQLAITNFRPFESLLLTFKEVST